MTGRKVLQKLWRWVNEKPLGASLVAGLVLPAILGFLAWIHSWDWWSQIKWTIGVVFHWLFVEAFSVTFSMAIWLCLSAFAVLLLYFSLSLLVERRAKHVETFSLLSYTEDVFDNIRWRWKWVKGYDGWRISDIAPYCECEGPLVPASSELAQGLAYRRLGDSAYLSINSQDFVCLSMTCGRTFTTNLPLHSGFDAVKSIIEEEVRTRWRRKIRDAQECARH